MRKYMIVAMAALAIASCGKKGADADGDGKISNEEVAKEMGKGGAMAMKPGLWEIKMGFDSVEGPGIKPEVANMMKSQASAQSIRTCMTKEQAEKPGSDFFGAPAEANCTFNQLQRSGDTMHVDMTCKPGGKLVMNSKMDGKFGADAYTLTLEQSTEGTPMGKVTMKGKMEGKRVGDCPT